MDRIHCTPAKARILSTFQARESRPRNTCTLLLICCSLFLFAAGFPAGALAQATNEEIAGHLQAIDQLTRDALEASRMAEEATSVADVKSQADRVFAAIWGSSSGIDQNGVGRAEKVHDWKTRWQSDTDDFELETPDQFGTLPPAITDPAQLGIIGRGRFVREQLWDSTRADAGNPHFTHINAALSNVIGWMHIDYAPARGGMPRVDLTYQWDAPSEFWQSTADTGWIFEAYSQALNILKVDYEGDLAAAHQHAADLSRLLEKAINGEDANGNGSVEPVSMEGGLTTALQHAGLAGLMQP
jgi:hypothetical protein